MCWYSYINKVMSPIESLISEGKSTQEELTKLGYGEACNIFLSHCEDDYSFLSVHVGNGLEYNYLVGHDFADYGVFIACPHYPDFIHLIRFMQPIFQNGNIAACPFNRQV